MEGHKAREAKLSAKVKELEEDGKRAYAKFRDDQSEYEEDIERLQSESESLEEQIGEQREVLARLEAKIERVRVALADAGSPDDDE